MSNQTVKKLLESLPLLGATVIAGKNGLNRIIDLFGILEAPDSIDFVKPNEFIITTGYSIKDNRSVQFNIIKQLIKRGAAGLGIKLNRYIRDFSDQILYYADLHDFPIISLPNALSWYEISSSIFSMNFTASSGCSVSIDVFRQNLIFSDTYEEILDHLSKLLKHTCTFFNKEESILIESSNFHHSIIMLNNIIDILDNNSISFMNISRVRYNLNNENVLVCPIHNNNVAQYIFVWEGKEQLSYEVLLTLQFAIMLINWKLLDFEKSVDIQKSEKNEFLLNLLLSNPTIDEHTYFKAKALMIEVIKSQVVLSIDCYILLNNQFRESIFTTDIIRTVKYICQRDEYVFCMVSDKSICLFISMKNENDMAGSDFIVARTQKIQNELHDKHPDNYFGIGIGNIARSLSEINHSFKTSRIALCLTNQLYGKGNIGDYSQLGIYKLLYDDEKGGNFTKYIEQYIIPITRVDTNGDLLKTLQLYLKNGRSIRKCSKDMFVHQNTITYRLKKLKKSAASVSIIRIIFLQLRLH